MTNINRGYLTGLERESTQEKALDRLQEGIIVLESPKIVLRKINDEDIEIMKKHYSEDIMYGNIPQPLLGEYILEHHGEEESVAFDMFGVLYGMRLLKKGDINISIIITPNINWAFPTLNLLGTIEPYLLNLDEIEEIKKIIKKVKEIRLTKNYLTILGWFNKSCERDRFGYDELIALMICSEALFCDEKFYRYTGSIIGTACSMLIGKNDDERYVIKSSFEDAYAIRNIQVHGGDINRLNNRAKNKLNSINLFNAEIKEYLRRSIKKLIF